MHPPILYQGSGGTIGDVFISSVPMYHQKVSFGREIYVAIPKTLPQKIRALYDYQPFLNGIIEMDDIGRDKFILEAQSRKMTPNVFLEDIHYYRNVGFYKLDEWFKNPKQPTIDTSNCVGMHIMTTNWHERRPMVYWSRAMWASAQL